MEKFDDFDFYEEDEEAIAAAAAGGEKDEVYTEEDIIKTKKEPRVTEYRRTQKRVAYARALIDGKSQRKAYLEAYPEHKDWKVNSIDCHASAIFHDPEFQKIYQEEVSRVEDELQRQYIWSKGRAVKRLLTAVNLVAEDLEDEYEKPLDARRVDKQIGKINALKALIGELNQMHGLNKQNIDVSGGFVVISGEDDLEG